MLSYGTDYTATGVGDPSGGNIVLVVPIAPGGESIVIKRIVPLTQMSDYVENDALPAEVLERGFDKLTMIAQQLQSAIVTGGGGGGDEAVQQALDAHIANTDETVHDVGGHIDTHNALATGVHGVGASTVETVLGSQAKVNSHAGEVDAHGATSAPTPNSIVFRDAAGRAKVVAGSASGDIIIKSQLDGHTGEVDAHGATATPTAGRIPLSDGSGTLDAWITLWLQSGSDIYRLTGNVGMGIAIPTARAHINDGKLFITNIDSATTGYIHLGHGIRTPGRAQLWLAPTIEQCAEIVFGVPGSSGTGDDDMRWSISSRYTTIGGGSHDGDRRIQIWERDIGVGWKPRFTIMPAAFAGRFAMLGDYRWDYIPSAILDITGDVWRKIDFVHGSVISRGRIGNDANGLNLATNTYWTGSAWAQDDALKSSFVIIQHLGNNRIEFRAAPAGVAPDVATMWLAVQADGIVLIPGQVKITSGTPGNGKVLTSDAAGLATWQDSGLTTHAAATTGIHGVGGSTVESATGSQAKVDTHAALTGSTAHAATAAATANRIMLRDASGRSAVAAGSASGDIVNKGQMDTAITTHSNLTSGIHGATATPTANRIPIANASGSLNSWVTGAFSQILAVRDKKTTGTAGGTFTSGAWQTRTLNEVVKNTISGASLDSNRMTLPAGDYVIWARAPAFKVDENQIRVQNVSDGTNLLFGGNAYSGSGGQYGSSDAECMGWFTLAATKNVEIQHRCVTTNASNGFGRPTGFGDEVYTEVLVSKL